MTKEALDGFLSRLSADREQAGQAYEQVRKKLVTFFRVNGCWEAEDLVDATLDRVVRRLQEVEVIDLMAFIRGVARHVASETHKSRIREIPLDDTPAIVYSNCGLKDDKERTSAERRFGCLDDCLKQLSPSDRDLMLEFYRFDGGQKIENKRRMADALGISLGTLRVRAFRVRETLEICVTKCMEQVPSHETFS